MSGDEPTRRQTLRSIKELEPILDGLRGALDRGVYGDHVDRDRVQWCLDEGKWYISESRKVTSRIMVLEERADRLVEEFSRLKRIQRIGSQTPRLTAIAGGRTKTETPGCSQDR